MDFRKKTDASKIMMLLRIPEALRDLLLEQRLLEPTNFKNVNPIGPADPESNQSGPSSRKTRFNDQATRQKFFYGGLTVHNFGCDSNQLFSAHVSGLPYARRYEPGDLLVFKWRPKNPKYIISKLRELLPSGYLDYSTLSGSPNRYVRLADNLPVLPGSMRGKERSLQVSRHLLEFLEIDVITDSLAEQQRSISVKLSKNARKLDRKKNEKENKNDEGNN